jgi:hypothetical protein
VLRVALVWTTVHTIKRQMRMKTQNMTVLTLEFTRTPLAHRGKMPSAGPPWNHATFFRRRYLAESVRKYTTPGRQTQLPCRLNEQ